MTLNLAILLTILAHVAFAGTRMAVSLFALELGASPFTVGVLLALYAFLPMLFSVHAGRAIDRIGVRRPMPAAAAIVTVGALVAWVWPELPTLFVLAAVVGSAFMTLHIATSQTIGALGHAAERPRNFSRYSLGFSVSGFAGPMIAGFAIDLTGFRTSFLILACFPLASFLLAVALGSRLPGADRSRTPAAKRRVADLVLAPALGRIFATSALLSIAWDLFAFAMPVHGARLGLSASSIGLIIGTFAAATFAVRVVLPLLAHRFGEWTLLVGAMLLGAAIYFAFPLVGHAAALALLAFGLGLKLNTSQPMVMSLLYGAVPPDRAAEAVGVRTTLVNASQTFMPLLFGVLGSVLGMLPVFWTMTALLLAGAWVARRS